MNGMLQVRRNSGFTMVELVMVMLIIGILSAIGIPTFRYVTASNRMSAEANALLGDLQFARAEAIKEGLPVTVCPSSNGTSCLTAAPSAWQSGWIIYVDGNLSGTLDATDPILRKQPAFTSTDTFVTDRNLTKAVTFNRMGYGSTGDTQTVTLLLHSYPTVNSSWTRCIAITSVGMLTTQRVPTGNCST